MAFPRLPPHAGGLPWSENVDHAYEIMSNTFNRAARVFTEESSTSRLRFHADALIGEVIPLLTVMENNAQEESIPAPWLHSCARVTADLAIQLLTASERSTSREESGVAYIDPVTTVRTGRRGRPRKEINLEFLQDAMSAHRAISISTLAKTLGIDRHILSKRLKEAGITTQFSALRRSDLDALVKGFRTAKPGSGVRYLIGFLRRHGLKVQKRRVFASVRRVDGLGRTLRQRQVIKRRTYKVSRPNALWHIDGHHKLILWGFVIHGIVDGYSRLVTGLRTSTNNRATTVLRLFLDAIEDFGMPSRMRGDRGAENKLAAVYIILQRGLNRASFIWGSSTHNTRIERLWVEVGRQFARRWRAFFYRLEALHGLDRSNATHLWLLHRLFLDLINNDCAEFQAEWNAHPISGAGHDKSPNDMFFLGKLQNGVYLDDCADLSPETIQDLYGVHGPVQQRAAHETGAGHLSDEDESADDEVDEELEDAIEGITAANEHHFHHEPVPVPKHASPFSNDALTIFDATLAEADRLEIIPSGYGIRPEEWDGGSYPAFEILKSGRKGNKELRVALPDSIWRPRAQMWSRALAVMDELMHTLENVESSSSGSDLD